MINGIGPAGTGRVDGGRAAGTGKTTPTEKSAAVRTAGGDAPANPAADLAASGPPVDPLKVAEIRAAIARGAYSIDVQAIAARMIELDLPPKG